jgi:undecaprenyl phosphate N,N'-diacetylbacillosamine 1-phosphate transferase
METVDMSQQKVRMDNDPVGVGRRLYIIFFKRFFDIVLSILALIVLSPVLLAVAFLVRIKLGSPIVFKQIRPGKKDKNGKEKLFILYKFRSMTNGKDKNGKLLPDDVRLTMFGRRLRDTSLDELPELWNILKGDMSIIGPRPLLVRDMVFMTDDQRRRHNIKPGLSGWAQVNGRNFIEWEDKLNYDLEYLNRAGLCFDIRIVFITVKKVLKTESITYEGMATAEDFGDYLLRTGKVTKNKYNALSIEAKEMVVKKK